MPIPIVGVLLRGPIAAWWRFNAIGTSPSDLMGAQVVHQLQTPGAGRDRLTADIYIPTHPDESLGRLEQAFQLSVQVEPLLKTIKTASRAGKLPLGPTHTAN